MKYNIETIDTHYKYDKARTISFFLGTHVQFSRRLSEDCISQAPGGGVSGERSRGHASNARGRGVEPSLCVAADMITNVYRTILTG